jgi:hypothetical protein
MRIHPIPAHSSHAKVDKSSLPKLAEILKYVGRPVAFYPALVPVLGSVNATLLFCQLFYWQGRGKHDYVYKNSYEIQNETGLTYAQQRNARMLLTRKGVLREKHARLQHELHFWLDLNQLLSLWLEYRLQIGARAA